MAESRPPSSAPRYRISNARILEVAPLLQDALVLASEHLRTPDLLPVPESLCAAYDELAADQQSRGFVRPKEGDVRLLARREGTLAMLNLLMMRHYFGDMAGAAKERRLDPQPLIFARRELQQEWIDGALSLLARLRLEAQMESDDPPVPDKEPKLDLEQAVSRYLRSRASDPMNVRIRDVAKDLRRGRAAGPSVSSIQGTRAWKAFEDRRKELRPQSVKAKASSLLIDDIGTPDERLKALTEDQERELEEETRPRRRVRRS